MNTLIYTSCLGFFCMLAEVFNLRKVILPVIALGLAVIFGFNANNWNLNTSYYNDMLRVDNFSVAFGGLLIFITLLIFIMAGDFYRDQERHVSDYSAIMLFILTGGLMMLGFGNMVMLFLGIETLSISLYVMAGSNHFDVRSNEAGFKYFLMGSFASCFLLLGIALIFGVTGSFNIQKIAEYTMNQQAGVSPLFLLGMALIVFSLLFKVSAVPFHFWAPDVYEGSPTLVTALMGTLVKVAAFGAFYRLMSVCFMFTFAKAETILIIVSVITLFAGNLIALAQHNFKRLLAYSGISHAGYLLIAIVSLRTNTASALFYYSLGYALSTIAAFAVAIAVFEQVGTEEIKGFNGLGKKNPFLAACLTMAMLGLGGIPPFAGFLGKYYIFTKALSNGYFWLVLMAIINSVIGIWYYFKVIIAMYGQHANDREVKGTFSTYLVVAVCILLSIVLGVYPSLVINLL